MSMILLNRESSTVNDDFKASTLVDLSSDQTLSSSAWRNSDSCSRGPFWILSVSCGKSVIKREKVGTKLLETNASSRKVRLTKAMSTIPAARERGIFLFKAFTGGSRSSCSNREIKMIKASWGIYQKVDNKMVKVILSRIEVR